MDLATASTFRDPHQLPTLGTVTSPGTNLTHRPTLFWRLAGSDPRLGLLERTPGDAADHTPHGRPMRAARVESTCYTLDSSHAAPSHKPISVRGNSFYCFRGAKSRLGGHFGVSARSQLELNSLLRHANACLVLQRAKIHGPSA